VSEKLLNGTSAQNGPFSAIISYKFLEKCANTLIKQFSILKPSLIGNIKIQQQLYVNIKISIFDKSNYIVDTGIIGKLPRQMSLEKVELRSGPRPLDRDRGYYLHGCQSS